MKNKMETNELTAHHRGVILRGICFGAALRGKSPEISEENTVIICQGELSIWDICSISADAEAFGLDILLFKKNFLMQFFQIVAGFHGFSFLGLKVILVLPS